MVAARIPARIRPAARAGKIPDVYKRQTLYIREIQNWLRALSFSDERIPLIGVDGIYGPETTEAVRAFQEIAGLPATGEVDKTTWDAIYIAFLSATGADRNPPSSVLQFPSPDYVVMPGDSGRCV